MAVFQLAVFATCLDPSMEHNLQPASHGRLQGLRNLWSLNCWGPWRLSHGVARHAAHCPLMSVAGIGLVHRIPAS